MNDDLDQLCRSLRLMRLHEILERELAYAQEHELSYSDFLARLLRAEYLFRQERSVTERIKRARIPTVDGRLKARISGEERASGPNIFTGCTAEKLPVERPLA